MKTEVCFRKGSFELLPDYVPPMRVWTPEEIQEAKSIIAEEAINTVGNTINIIKMNDNNFSVELFNKESWRTIIRKSKKCKTDEYNEYIGVMVAICKTTGRVLPEWLNRR